MILDYFNDYSGLGISCIPIEWDTVKKQPVSHTEWSKDQVYTVRDRHNGLMIKTQGDFGCLDFDLKNTQRKTIFDEWKQIILNTAPGLYEKLFVEQTRNKGYHVWMRYKKFVKKESLADSPEGSEVIALYAKGPLVYTFPSPGYTEVSGSMYDTEYITDEEYSVLISTAQYFNEYKPAYDPTKKAVSYPEGMEAELLHFDTSLTDDAWITLLNDIGLVSLPDYRYNPKDKFTAFKRRGSESSAISAKVYFKTKRVLIFSASMHDFPNWHNRDNYPVWALPPSFVLFYKNGRDWNKAIEELRMIADACGMAPPVDPPTYDFPLHVFPGHYRESILQVCQARNISVQFAATAGLWTVSSLAGTRYTSDFNGDARNILFCLLVAPVSVGKTPAFKVMCETPLRIAHEVADQQWNESMEDYKREREENPDKKFTLKKPRRFIPIAVDGTTEGYIQKSMIQPNGIGVYQDEAETIFNAGSFKSNNDAVSFFTQAFSGGRISQIRVDEEKERVVPNLNLNLLMGTQKTRLGNIFTEDRLASGFASRFLMVESDYQELNVEADPFSQKKEMCERWVKMVTELFFEGQAYNSGNGEQVYIRMSDEAKEVYRSYYRQLLQDANTRIKSKAESYVIGTEAKMSAYFPRLCQILAILHNHHLPVITEQTVHDGWQLYRYYADSTIRIIAGMHQEIETGLPGDLELLYQALPAEFTRAEAVTVCERLNLTPRRFDVSIRRKDFSKLFMKVGQGQYRKI